MIPIAVDLSYAKPLAYAYRDVAGLWHAGEVHHRNVDEFEAVFHRAWNNGATALVTEQLFLGANPKVCLRLSQMQGHVERIGLHEKLGEWHLTPHQVAPSRWQSDMLSQGRQRKGDGKLKHAQLARLAKMVAYEARMG